MLVCAYAIMLPHIFYSFLVKENIIQETSMMGSDFNVAANY